MSYLDIDPQDIDPETNRPYSNYSSPSLDTSFHDHEMAGEDDEPDELSALREIRAEISRLNQARGETVFNPAATQLLDAMIAERALPYEPREDEECANCGGTGIDNSTWTFDAGDGEGEDRPCPACAA